MKGKFYFITRVVLITLIAVGCLSYRSVSADGDPIKYPIEFGVDTSVVTTIEGDLVYDLYKIAKIEWDGSTGEGGTTYKLEAEAPFAEKFNGKNVGVDKTTGKIKGTELDPKEYTQGLANEAAKIIFADTTPLAPIAGSPYKVNELKTVEPGFYLAVMRSTGTTDDPIAYTNTDKYLRVPKTEGENYTSYANSRDKTYVFDVYPVFVKGDNAKNIALDEQTTDQGLRMIKYTVEDRFGLIKIVKHVSLGGQAATVVFKVQGYENEAASKAEGAVPIYEKVLAVDVNEAGEYAKDDSLIIDDIPVGTYVVVNEVYAGASYECEWYKTVVPEKGQTILPVDQLDKENNKPIPQTWEFYNKLNDKSKKGYGITNRFEKENGTWGYVDPNQTAAGGEQ